MVKKGCFCYDSADNRTKIYGIRWEPEGRPKAVLQISHGMVEFVDRYDSFARFLCERGFLVVGNDHLGHGRSITCEENFGYFAEENGNGVLLEDLYTLTCLTKKQYGEIPYFLLGHSMGSFLARQYLCEHGKELTGAIIMGTGYQPRIAAQMGKIITRRIAARKGWKYRSAFVDNMAFGGYNKKFEPARTSKDWLTRDKNVVDAYLTDKRCTFTFTVNGYYNLFVSLDWLTHSSYVERMPKDLPVFFVAGKDDPVGNFGKGVVKVAEQFRKLGMKDVSEKLYVGARHEILQETNRLEVFEDLANWLTCHMG